MELSFFFKHMPVIFCVYEHKAYVNLYGLFILGVNIKYMLFSILYGHINTPVAFKELTSLKLMVHSYFTSICMCLITVIFFQIGPSFREIPSTFHL